MTSIWSNCELLYSMPAVGATKSNTTASVITGNAAGNPAYQLPPLASLWSQSAMVGKSIVFVAAGTYDTGTTYAVTTNLSYDATQGSAGTTIAATGAASTWPVGATNNWWMEVTATCISSGLNTSGWMTGGTLTAGTGNNAATTAAASWMMGGAQTAGVPNALALATVASIGYIEIWSTWATSPVAQVCSQFKVFAEN